MSSSTKYALLIRCFFCSLRVVSDLFSFSVIITEDVNKQVRRVKDNEVKTEERWRKEQERQMGIRHEQEHSGLMIWYKKC